MFGTLLFADSVFADLPELEYIEIERAWQLMCPADNAFVVSEKADNPWHMPRDDKYTILPCKE